MSLQIATPQADTCQGLTHGAREQGKGVMPQRGVTLTCRGGVPFAQMLTTRYMEEKTRMVL